jgi:hypothetical protein
MDRAATTCPACGASNPRGAPWCARCYARPEGEHAVAVRREGWDCRRCGATNAPALDACAGCGSAIFDSFGVSDPVVLPGEAVRASVVPGLGMMRVGLRVEGALALVLVVFAMAAGLAVVAAGNGGGWVLVLVGIATWLVAARDAYVVATRSDDAWLQPRAISLIAGVVIIAAAILVLRTPVSGTP